jgi:hypothetical protein
LNEKGLSRLELYVEVLKAIGKKPTSLVEIQKTAQVDEDFLFHAVNFLEKQSLITSRTVADNVLYRNTSKGTRVCGYFCEKCIRFSNYEFSTPSR